MKLSVYACVWIVATAHAVAGPSKVTTMNASYQSGDETVSGYLAVPDSKGPFPAIVVIHEWWGLNDWVKENARRFAGQGYVTLAVDLYRGKVAADADLAHELSRGLPEDRASRDLVAAVTYLRSRPDVEKQRIGSVGWCMGGGYSLALALRQADLRSCVICYGRLVTDTSALAKLGASVLGIFGGRDRGIPVEGVRQFEKSLKDAGKSVSIQVYENAGHAFMNPNNKSGYREVDANDAWKRIDEFFLRTLKDMKKGE
jgi:carboxymethylenebutenolidase